MQSWKKTAGKSLVFGKLGASMKKSKDEKVKKLTVVNSNLTAKERLAKIVQDRPSPVYNVDEEPSETCMSPEVTQVISSLTETKEKRVKSAIRDSMKKINERVKRVIENSGEEEEEDSQAVSTANSVRAGALQERLKRIEEQKVVVGKIMDFIEDCANRFSLLGEVNEWLWKDHALHEFQQELEDQLSQTIIENEIDFEAISEEMAGFEQTLLKFMRLICRLMDETGLFQRDTKRQRNQVQIYDESTLLKSADKWDSAVDNIASVFEDAIRWIKNPAYKTSVRNGLRQFRQLAGAVVRRNAHLLDTKRHVNELKKKIETTKLSKEKLEKDSEKMGRRLLQYTQQISELKAQAEEAGLQTGIVERSKGLLEEKVKELEDKWKEKDKGLKTLEAKVKQLEEELKRAQELIPTGRGPADQRGQADRRDQRYGQTDQYQYSSQRRPRGQYRPPAHQGSGQKGDETTPTPQQEGTAQKTTEAKPTAKAEDWPSPFEDEEDWGSYNTAREESYKADFAFPNDRLIEQLHDEDVYDDEYPEVSPAGFAHDTSPIDLPPITVKVPTKSEEDYQKMMAEPPVAPPPDINKEQYYKQLISDMKLQFHNQMEKLKQQQIRAPLPALPRTEAEKKRLERFHKDSLPSIQREATHIFQAMEQFTENMAGLLTKEQLRDSLVELHKLSGLISSQISNVDPLKMLTQMSNRVGDYLRKVVDVLSRAFLSMRMRMNAAPAMKQETPVHMRALQHQLDNLEQAKRQTMKAFYSLGKLRHHLKGPALKQLQHDIKWNSEEVAQKDTKYVSLMKRYGWVWGMYSRLEKEVEGLNGDFEDMLQTKLAAKEEMIIKRITMEMREKKDFSPKKLYLSVKEILPNLTLLDQAFEENKISKKLYSMTIDSLHHALSLPQKRVSNLFEKYVSFRAYKDVVADLEREVSNNATKKGRREKLQEFCRRLRDRHNKFKSVWKKRNKSFNIERNNVFSSIWQLFNTVLLESGLLLQHPLLQDKTTTLLPSIPSHTAKEDRRKLGSPYLFLSRHRCRELPTRLVGERLRLFGNRGLNRLPIIHVAPSGEKPEINCPQILNLDINKPRIVAQRTLEKVARQAIKMSVTQGYVVNTGDVNFLNDTINMHRT